jgi:hypothetical protein
MRVGADGAMRTSDLVISGILAAIGLATIIESVRVVNSQGANVVVDVIGPGPYLLGLGVLLLVSASAHFASSLRRTSAAGPRDPADTGAASQRNVFFSFLTLAAYVVLIDVVGYALSTLLFFFVQLRLFGRLSIVAGAAIAACLTGAFYLLFIEFGGMSFPRGLW